MRDIIFDKRYLAYYLFTSFIISTILVVEDVLEGDRDYHKLLLDFITDIPIFSLLILFISIFSYYIIKFLNKTHPWEKAGWKRFILEIGVVVILVLVLTTAGSYLVRNFDFMPKDVDGDFGFEILALIMFFIGTFMVFSFHEFMMLSSDKQYLAYKAGMLEKQNYMIKYEALKSQVNPHFLFNSLNVLSSLIYQDTAKSDLFIKKFSEVFRYVLELNQEKLVEVKSELKFLDSYFFLQKIRYGDSLVIRKTVDADALCWYIPPLTLQLVVENAIKHNVISKEQRLTITIENGEDELIVRNNYQHRGNFAGSTGIGQQNLKEKYQLIDERSPKFYIENDEYVVKLPIIKELSWNGF